MLIYRGQTGSRMLRSTLPATIEISTDTGGAVPAVLHDPVQLGQVVLNLCINARNAIGAGGGAIHVAVHHTRDARLACTACRQPLSGDFVELSVGDTGCGIPPGIMDRIFEPFFTTKEIGKGSRMGLAMVHGIVHEQGGHVMVGSGAGGTRFRVLMRPLDSAVAPPPGEPVTAREPRGKMRLRGRVLVVDDEPPVREFMRDLLDGPLSAAGRSTVTALLAAAAAAAAMNILARLIPGYPRGSRSRC